MQPNNKIDDNIEFDEPNHKYNYGNHKFNTSVTTFVHKHFPPFIKNDVIRNILGSKKMTDPNYDYYGLNSDKILELWDRNAMLGTIMHEQIEYFYNNNNTSREGIDTIEYRYFLNFARDFYYINPYKTELRIYSIELDLAGSIDLLVKNPDGTYFIADWKRAKCIDTNTIPNTYTQYGTSPGTKHIMSTNLNHYTFQLNVYRYILQKEYGFVVTGMALVVCHPNNKSKNYEIHSVPIMDMEMEIIMNIRRQKVKDGSIYLEIDDVH